MILLIVICVLLLGLSGFLIFVLGKSLNRNRLYENFYKTSIEDVDAVIDNLDEILYRRQLLSDDQDVRKIYKSISILRDVLGEYNNYYEAKKFLKKEERL